MCKFVEVETADGKALVNGDDIIEVSIVNGELTGKALCIKRKPKSYDMFYGDVDAMYASIKSQLNGGSGSHAIAPEYDETGKPV